ncbi:MAG: response regulator [Verrucomicrobiota bacterium]
MRPKILVVDDAKAVRLLARTALAPYDCEISEAANGYNALFLMEKSLPGLILLDVNMPVMDGLELLTLLKSKPALAAIPVIMLTSPADHGVRVQLMALGIHDTVMKPFTAAALAESIRRVLALEPLPLSAPPQA